MVFNLRESAICSLAAISVAVLFSSAAVGADETGWRFVKFDDGKAMLVVADTDEATDAIGSFYFRCKPGSGSVTVIENNMQDKRVRAAIADLILNDRYPTVELGPEKSAIEEITSSDDGGWGYHFQIDPDGVAFNRFKKTGYFKFKIESAPIEAGIKAGFDKIAEFQAVCRRPSK